jgi:hypothetical protein
MLIGGPSLNVLLSSINNSNSSKSNYPFILVGRRGLCAYNGIFKIKNFDFHSILKNYPKPDPNECYFEDTSNENNINRLSEKSFYHITDLRLSLNLNEDNRFAWDAPTVSSVYPKVGDIYGGQEIKIGGFNFGTSTNDIQLILIGGILCNKIINLSPNLLSCTSGDFSNFPLGPKNVIIKLRNGYSSPIKTCNVFNTCGTKKEINNPKSQINNSNSQMNNNDNKKLYPVKFEDLSKIDQIRRQKMSKLLESCQKN